MKMNRETSLTNNSLEESSDLQYDKPPKIGWNVPSDLHINSDFVLISFNLSHAIVVVVWDLLITESAFFQADVL